MAGELQKNWFEFWGRFWAGCELDRCCLQVNSLTFPGLMTLMASLSLGLNFVYLVAYK